MINVNKIKKDFPIFDKLIDGEPLIYLDSTASSLKPRSVIEAVADYYSNYSVNVFRGLYKLSEKATKKYEEAREKVAQFIGAKDSKEIVFVRSATEAINLVAYSWGRVNLDERSEIISTVMEHHANLVPWQQLAIETGATIKYIEFDEEGYLDINSLEKAITINTKLLTLTYISNVLGTINPVRDIVRLAKRKNPKIVVLIDAAAAVPHLKVDVKDLGCDFIAFSGHKMLGPTGIGVLWGKYDLLDCMLPFEMGGEMIKEVYLEKTVFKDPPHKFEAGTPHIAGAIGLAAAIDYLTGIGMEDIREHEKELVKYALSNLSDLPARRSFSVGGSHLRIYGPMDPTKRGGLIAFNLPGIHAHDVAQVLDRYNICIRSGHHCAMPLHQRLGIAASCRASLYIYNSKEDMDKLMEGLEKVQRLFQY